MLDIFLNTDRLSLRRFCDDDVPLLLELDTDPGVMRFVNGGRPLVEAFLRENALPQIIAYNSGLGGFGYWAAHEQSNGAFIGWCYLLPPGVNLKGAELGYRLKRACWGKGFATEVSKALIARGFQKPSVLEIEATAMRANTASIRVMEKIRMHLVEEYEEFSFPGQDKSAVRYRLTREEWERNY
ncbi:GNAT family N-acetyltransferase [soil metagenome]